MENYNGRMAYIPLSKTPFELEKVKEAEGKILAFFKNGHVCDFNTISFDGEVKMYEVINVDVART
jgi:hypothetical protein